MAVNPRFTPQPFAIAIALLSLTSSLHAQPAPAPAPAGAAGPAAPQIAETPPAAAPSTPPSITVDETLLAPIPAAPKILTTWQEAVQLVDSRSTDLRIAEQDIARAVAQSRQALGRILPTLNATASLARQPGMSNQPGGTTIFGTTIEDPFVQRTLSETTQASINLSIPILAPQTWYAYGTARQAVEMAKLSTIDRRRLLVTNVASAIVAVFTAERVSEINRVGLRTALERLELTRRRTRLGSGTRLDVVRTEQDLTLATNTIIQGNESLRRSREALGLALGDDVPYGVAPNISLNSIENSIRSMCRVGKPEERADIRAAQQQLEINRRQVKETQLSFLPTASVEIGANTGSSHATTSYVFQTPPPDAILSRLNQEQPTNRTYAWSIRAVINIPIFEGSRYGTLALNRATADQQTVRIESALRQARLDVTQAERAVEVAEQSRVNSETARDLAKETARLTQVSYEAGTATSFELIDASRRQRETELDLVVKEFEVLRAKVAALLAAAVCDE